ncbi:MAG: N-sulfoglucosamine sulfohydrolase [Pirellulaceae bacterium]|jgi:N-sulfoglucosamine sulfohydrolase
MKINRSAILTIRFTLLLAACVYIALSNASWLTAAEKPNLVFIIADDCTFRDIGCYGGQANTPNIDKLATEGMRFTHCFQAAPMCSPTRHNIYTGQYPVKSGAYPNHTFAKDDVKSIVQYLKPLGYRVALSGKKHIGPKSVLPFEFSGANNPDMKVIDKLFSESVQNNSPFCLFACSNEPHSPWNKGDASKYPPSKVKLPPYFLDTPVVRENFSNYLAEIGYFDGQVGQILDLLKQHKLDDNTLVMVVSEQGSGFPFAKWTCYDNGLQSAMIVRWPGKVKSGSETAAMVEYCDVTPTFVDAAGGKQDPQMDGKSFLSVLTGEANEHKQFVYGIMTTRGIINGNDNYPIRSVRSRNHKLILNLNHEAKFTNACTKSPIYQSMLAAASTPAEKELVNAYQVRPAVELYDVVADPLERNNLASDPKYKGEIAKLQEELESWMKSQGDGGVTTELRAKERQHGGKKKPAGKKNADTKADGKKKDRKKKGRKEQDAQ